MRPGWLSPLRRPRLRRCIDRGLQPLVDRRPSRLPSGPGYRAPPWLPGRHAQTVYPALFAPRAPLRYERSFWQAPDGDRLAVDACSPPVPAGAPASPGVQASQGNRASPSVLLLHGLEGDSGSHYARALMAAAAARGATGRVVHWRGCGGVPGLRPRAYHSGDSAELDWIVRQALGEAAGPVCLVGVSLGGNVLLKWLGEQGRAAGAWVHRAVAVSVPFSLDAGAAALERGIGRLYGYHFLRTMRPKARAMLRRYPGLFDGAALERSVTLRDFDNVFTAPVHGFRGAEDYYERCSSIRFLHGIRVPTLLISARNDPFLPAQYLPRPEALPDDVQAEFSDEGGHAGFCCGPFPGHSGWLAARILDFLGI
jgi:uncharacterized protein